MAQKQKPTETRDHVDRFLESPFIEEIPNLDIEVEGIVGRINGLSRRFKQSMNETLSVFGLSVGEWSVLGALRRAGPPHRRSPGELADMTELSSGAMTNRLDHVEAAGFVRRRPDPDDRRALQVELTKAGHKIWEESTGAEALKEALVAGTLNEREKEQLNSLLRRLMLAFEAKEGRRAKS